MVGWRAESLHLRFNAIQRFFWQWISISRETTIYIHIQVKRKLGDGFVQYGDLERNPRAANERIFFQVTQRYPRYHKSSLRGNDLYGCNLAVRIWIAPYPQIIGKWHALRDFRLPEPCIIPATLIAVLQIIFAIWHTEKGKLSPGQGNIAYLESFPDRCFSMVSILIVEDISGNFFAKGTAMP